jgi:adenylosuccinate synthase
MPQTVLVLSGPVGAGKTTLAQRLAEGYGGHVISTHALLTSRLGDKAIEERGALQLAGERLDRQTKGAWVRDEARSQIESLPQDSFIIIDSVRVKSQLDQIRESYGRRVVHLHLRAPEDVLTRRYADRTGTAQFKELKSYAEVQANRTERNVRKLERDADIVIDTARCTMADVEIRAAAHLGFSGRDPGRLVDVIVGGEYGSEGKGNVAFYLAPEYDLLMRVGGPNAGHKVPRYNKPPFTHRLLPSGTQNSEAPLLLGPGAVLDVDVLLSEIADSKVEHDRLTIDPQAMIITSRDVRDERRLMESIGSTGKGVGYATARRIRNRIPNMVKLAKDVPALQPFIGSAYDVLTDVYAKGGRVMLEGTQGTMLSLYHGEYPYVTSRDTTVAGCLAEAGIAPGRVRRVIMVCRTYPIRVQSPEGASSGYMSQPLEWAAIAARSGIPLDELEDAEKGSVSHKLRRVAEFDWALLHRAAQLNGATDIALTFVDYINIKNRDARRVDQLTDETIRFIEEVERVAGANVSLISTRFHPRSIIDRRHWA